jgi:ribosomal protein S18 acetylase RimI-like enzyme
METIKLPINEWEKYRDLRLRALKEDPQAFGSSYRKSLEYSPMEWQRRLKNAMEEKTDWLVFAKDENKLVGMMGAYIDKEGPSDIATIVSVYVPSEERGKGISKMLMQELLKRISNNENIRKAKLGVNKKQIAAVGLYNSFGFKNVGERKYVMGNGEEVDEYIMERQIDKNDQL